MMRGLTGVIEMASGNLTIHPHEDLDIEPQGITIHHNDSYDTKTFIPVFTIKMIRYHVKAKEKDGRNVGGAELAKRSTSPVGINEAIEMTRRAIGAAVTVHECCGCSCDVCENGHSKGKHSAECQERFFAAASEEE